MNSTTRSTCTTIKPRSGIRPMSGRSVTKTPQVPSSLQTEVNVLTAKQKLETLDRLANDFNRDTFEKWLDTMDSDDDDSEVTQLEETQSCQPSIAKNLQGQFDLVSDSFAVGSDVTEIEKESTDWDCQNPQVPVYVAKICEAKAKLSEWSKLRRDKLDADHQTESNELLNLYSMLTEMEKNVIPALIKIIKEPGRFNELIRKDPPLNGVLSCNIEDQKNLVENLMNLSEDCRQLYNLDINASDLEKEFEYMADLTSHVDSKINTKAVEKYRLHGMKELLEKPLLD